MGVLGGSLTKKSLNDFPDVFVSTKEITKLASKAVQAGKLRKLASRLYTKNLTGDPELIVKQYLWEIVAGYFPDALIADRTALEGVPAKDGSVFLVTQKGQSDIALPGHALKPRRGAIAQPSDSRFMGILYLSSQARALLDNFAPSRSRTTTSRTLSKEEIEVYLENYMQREGEVGLNRIRDESRSIAPAIDRMKEFDALNKLIATLLNTHNAKLLTPYARARQRGVPFDTGRKDLFEQLRIALHGTPPLIRPAAPQDGTTLPFFEAYFSNFIEGTEFPVKEAAEIVFDNRIPQDRPQDAHDIIGTYRIIASPTESVRVPEDFSEFERLLKHRHAEVMRARPDKMPGQYKERRNSAGNTIFVAPDLVRGTLEQGFKVYRSLQDPFQRAVFVMFLVAEVHPFVDGNGRIARIMMNAELTASSQQRIIVPTVYRSNYLMALKAISNRSGVDQLIRMLEFAQRFTQSIDWTDFDRAEIALEKSNAFLDSRQADDAGIRLLLPNRNDGTK